MKWLFLWMVLAIIIMTRSPQKIVSLKRARKLPLFFNAVVKAGKVNELDSTVLEFCEGDYDKAAKMLGLSLDI